MDETKKDKTPYIVFACKKCNQYIYAKSSQKNKKCSRCGHAHRMSEMISSGTIVNGISNALCVIKNKQDELALKVQGSPPKLRPFDKRQIDLVSGQDALGSEKNSTSNFTKDLMAFFKIHEEIPKYAIELLAEQHKMSRPETNRLIRNFVEKGVLTPQGYDYYKIRKSKKKPESNDKSKR